MNFLRFIKYLPRVFWKKGLPLNLIFFVTSRCNARCRHCFYWKELDSQKDELILSQIEKLARSAPSLLALSLTGGEPFLRDDLSQIALIFSRFTKIANLQIPTNGLLTEKIFEATSEILKNIRQDVRVVVGVSFDDMGARHDDIRQVEGCWDRAVETARRLKLLEKEFPNFLVASTITMTRENQTGVGKLVDFLKNELKLKEVAVNLVRSEIKDMSLKEVDIRYYDEVSCQLRDDFQKRTGLGLIDRLLSARQYLGSRLLSRIYKEDRFITPCYAGSLLAVLKEEGSVYPCEMLNLLPAQAGKMGNLKDFDFNLKKLWFSKQAQKVRQTIKKNKCFCTYECAMTLNTLFNPRHLLTILKDSLKRK